MPAYGLSPYGVILYNGTTGNGPSYSTDLAVFNGFSLADMTNTMVEQKVESEPSLDILGDVIPRDHGMYTIATYFREKTIELQGIVKRPDRTSLTAYLDTMRNALRGQGNLDITENGLVKRYTAILKNPESLFADRKGYNVTVCPFHAIFTCRIPFGKDRFYTATTKSISSSPTTLSFTMPGTMESQPIITLIFGAASSVTAVNITNTVTGEQIQYTGTINATDVLVFDSEQHTVKKNSTIADFDGSFLRTDVGVSLFRITVTGTSFTCTASIRAKGTYL